MIAAVVAVFLALFIIFGALCLTAHEEPDHEQHDRAVMRRYLRTIKDDDEP